MNFVADREILLSKLTKAVKFVPGKTVLPVYDNFKLAIAGNDMNIFASDGNIQFRIHCRIESNENTVICIPAKLLVKTLSLSRENIVKFSLSKKKKNTLELKIGKSKYEIGMNATENEFSMLKVTDPVSDITMEQFFVNMALGSTEKFADGKANANFSGINMVYIGNSMVFTGLDGQLVCRCAVKAMSVQKEWQKVVIPSETASAVAGFMENTGEIGIVHNGDKISFFCHSETGDSFEITSILSNAKFPDSEKFFRLNHQNKIKVNTLELLDAVKRLKLYSHETSAYRVLIETNPDNLNEFILTAIDDLTNKAGEEIVAIENLTGTTFRKAFSADMTIKVLSTIETNEVIYKYSEIPTEPSFIDPVVTSKEEEFFSFLTSQQADK